MPACQNKWPSSSRRFEKVCSSSVFFIRTSVPSFNVLSLLVDGLAAYGKPAVSLKVVFLPLLAFQATILIDNFR
jgi:hypothetical protein